MAGPVAVVANAASGKCEGEEACDRFVAALRRAGVEAELLVARTGSDLEQLARKAAANGARTLVAVGGDGTLNTVANVAGQMGCALGVLPAGTFNFFARSLGIPEDPDAAAALIAGTSPRPVDLLEVNGRLVLNNASMGVYPAVLDARERTYQKLGRSRWAAYLSALKALWKYDRVLDLTLVLDGEVERVRTPFLFVAANPLQLIEYGLPGRRCLDLREAVVFHTRSAQKRSLASLAARVALRRAKGAEHLEKLCARDLLICARRPLVVAIDGERVRLGPELRCRYRQGALLVHRPDVRAHWPVGPAVDAAGVAQ